PDLESQAGRPRGVGVRADHVEAVAVGHDPHVGGVGEGYFDRPVAPGHGGGEVGGRRGGGGVGEGGQDLLGDGRAERGGSGGGAGAPAERVATATPKLDTEALVAAPPTSETATLKVAPASSSE